MGWPSSGSSSPWATSLATTCTSANEGCPAHTRGTETTACTDLLQVRGPEGGLARGGQQRCWAATVLGRAASVPSLHYQAHVAEQGHRGSSKDRGPHQGCSPLEAHPPGRRCRTPQVGPQPQPFCLDPLIPGLTGCCPPALWAFLTLAPVRRPLTWTAPAHPLPGDRDPATPRALLSRGRPTHLLPGLSSQSGALCWLNACVQ